MTFPIANPRARPPQSPVRACASDRRPPRAHPAHVLPRQRGVVKVARALRLTMASGTLAPIRRRRRGTGDRRRNRHGREGSAVELEFTTEQEELRSSVRSFLEKECPVDVVRAVVETGEAPEKLWGSMVALDWPALAVPEEYGGIGLTILETAVVVEELGRAIAPGPLLATVTQFAPVVREVGTPEQQQRFLSAVASGAITGTVALADHPRGWALDDVTMTAEPAEGGWVLTGAKFGVLAAEGTTEVVVIARAGDGMGAFVVPAAEAGLAPVHSLDASRPLSEATLDHVFVPTTVPSASPGARASTLGIARALQEATVGLALETVGTCDALFQTAAGLRQGPPAVRRPHRFLPGDQAQDEQHVPRHRAGPRPVLLRRRRHQRGHAEPGDGRLHGQGRRDDCQSFVGRESIQTFGGIGFTWEHDCHLFVKRAATERRALRRRRRSTPSPWPPPWVSVPPKRQTGSVRPGESLIAALDLAPHPEGGWYRRTWVADAEDGARPAGSAIYYLLLGGEVSAPHRVDATELWHFYDGDPLELRREWPDGRRDVRSSGPMWRRVSRRSSSWTPASGSRRARSGATRWSGRQ